MLIQIANENRPLKSNAPQAFETAEEAWFWFINAMQARHDGARIVAGLGQVIRPCEPVDIYKAVDRLYRTRRLLIDHLKVMRHYGLRGIKPDHTRIRESLSATLWDEAMDRLAQSLKLKGIIS
jgi:hypothetical protein